MIVLKRVDSPDGTDIWHKSSFLEAEKLEMP